MIFFLKLETTDMLTIVTSQNLTQTTTSKISKQLRYLNYFDFI